MERARRKISWSRGLLEDALRVPAALVLWNLRKTAYRRRADGTRCPCQHPSDSGRPLETHCDAAVDWNAPGRFRLVCPALRTTAQGYCCSLATRDVRPYWGRAVLLFALSLLLAYLAGVSLGYGTLRMFGNHDVAWLDLAWPGRWDNIARTRSRQFCADAIVALSRRDYTAARLGLRSALEADDENYDAALLLAMLDSLAANADTADAAFQWLIQRHPAQASRSAIAFHDILLAKGRPDRLARFSLWMATEDAANSPLWTRALLISLRLAADAPAFARTYAAALQKLPPPARALVAAEILLQEKNSSLVRLALQRPVDPFAAPAYALVQVEQLLRNGDIAGAVVVKTDFAPNLSPIQSLGLQYWIEKSAGNDPLALACFAKCTTRPLTPADVDWLAGLLVRAPDRAALASLDHVARPLPFDPGVACSLWIASILCDDAAAATHWATALRTQARWKIVTPHSIRFDTLDLAVPQSVPALLSHLPFSRETIYALLSRVRAPVPRSEQSPPRRG